jgi:hypothetical protein
MKLYNIISKKNYVKIFKIFDGLYKNDYKNYILNIIDISDLLEKNIPKFNLNNYFIEIFEYELKKKEEKGKKDIIKYILNNKFSFLHSDLIPIMDIVFSKAIKEKLKFDNQIENYLKFDSTIFDEINQILGKNEDTLKEMLLFYFENKIMREINKKNMTDKNFFGNNKIRNSFITCIEFLGNEYNNRNNILSVEYVLK